jgi:hypothetical protein
MIVLKGGKFSRDDVSAIGSSTPNQAQTYVKTVSMRKKVLFEAITA